MISSLDHLVTSGLSAYSEELTRVVRSIGALVGGGGGMSVIPTVLLPLGVEGGIGVRLL